MTRLTDKADKPIDRQIVCKILGDSEEGIFAKIAKQKKEIKEGSEKKKE